MFVVQLLEGLEEGFAPFFVQVAAVGYEFLGVVPFVVLEEDVQGEELEDADSRVEVSGRVGAVGLNGATSAGGAQAFEAGGDVQPWVVGGCEVVF